MCGITAILLHPQRRTANQWHAIRDVFTQSLVFNEERGKAATGMAIADINGEVRLYKNAIAASKFVHMPAYQETLSKIGTRTTLIMGHTRFPTKGDPSNNGNNHPVQAGPVFGVHNGRIENDDELFARCGCERTADVDSEIIFRLIESVNPATRNGQYLREVRPLIRILQGQCTFLAFDQRKPEQLLVLKHNNPLCVHFHREWNALVFSSRYVFLRKAFGTPLVAEALEHDQLMLFDARGIAELGASPKQAAPLFLDGVPNGT